MIEVSNLWKKFDCNQVLKEVNLFINKGETMVIIGQSGGGKSVLLKHIIGLLKPDQGSIKIFNEDVTKLPKDKLNRIIKKFGMVFQNSALFDSLTVAENVGFYLSEHTEMKKEEIREIVTNNLSLVGLHNIEDLYPASLSGGMKKRVALARAISTNPEIILYDEPTTGIDPIMGAIINDLIIKLKKELHLTSIAVTHDMVSAYTIADRIAMLYQGRIIEVGTPEEIKNTKNKIVKQFISGNANGPITNN
ncbi:ABC transporter ATP-binding protein [bacterium]|nr:ABC transporter ATP-binding protein [bacterium]MBU1153201.1 ABC transporter ATP-binding protein [bacterium]MBU1782517.1 ABC transporter ATP-binding protein [bacterium]